MKTSPDPIPIYHLNSEKSIYEDFVTYLENVKDRDDGGLYFLTYRFNDNEQNTIPEYSKDTPASIYGFKVSNPLPKPLYRESIPVPKTRFTKRILTVQGSKKSKKKSKGKKIKSGNRFLVKKMPKENTRKSNKKNKKNKKDKLNYIYHN